MLTIEPPQRRRRRRGGIEIELFEGNAPEQIPRLRAARVGADKVS
jgi:hypothetical protein